MSNGKEEKRRNPVAKNLNKFNKPAVHRDRKHDYKRKPKHPKKVLTDT